MKNVMRLGCVAVAALVVSVVARDAVCDGALAAPAPDGALRFGALPQAALTTAPPKTGAPEHIPATEKVAGLWVVARKPAPAARASMFGSSFGGPSVGVYTSQSQANDFAAGKFPGSTAGDGTCLAVGHDFASGQWSHALDDRITLQPTVAPPKLPSPPPKPSPNALVSPPGGRVQTAIVVHPSAIHTERLVMKDAGAVLQIRDAWVDPDTLGARLITSAEMPLALVATGPSGLKVFAAKGDDIVHFVIPRALDHGTSVESTQGTASSTCGHVRLGLHAQRSAADSATVTSSLPADASGPRMLRTTLSSTFLSRDTEPVLAIDFGWAR